MDIKLRPVNPETDFPRLAEIINQFEPISVTAERLHEWEANRPEGQLRQRHAAVDEAGYVVGFGEAVHQPWEQAGRFWVEVAVDSALARQGIGTQLYADAWQFAQQQGVTKAKSAVRDNCVHCLRFAEQRSFVIDRHIFDSTLALDTFDEQPFAGTIEAVEARGIRFFKSCRYRRYRGSPAQALRAQHQAAVGRAGLGRGARAVRAVCEMGF